MNPLLIRAVLTVATFRREFKFVLLTFILVLLLPVVGVIALTNTGTNIVSSKIASINTKTNLVEIHDPLGKVVTKIDSSTVWPVRGVVTLEFGQSDLPYQPLHTGIDIAGNIGDPVTVFMKGKVIYIGNLSWGYGKHIIVDHGNNITSIYAHLSEIDTSVGKNVKPGDIIGLEGQTGWATGPHVHFQIDVFGIPVNPRTFVEGNP